jgi:hypothetical protein
MKCQNCDRLQSILDESNRILLIKKKLIEKLNTKVIELGSKIKEDETLIKKLKNQNKVRVIHRWDRFVNNKIVKSIYRKSDFENI